MNEETQTDNRVVFSTKLSLELVERIKAQADKEQRTIVMVLTRALERYLEKEGQSDEES